MKSSLTKFALSVGVMLAMAFTFSCSGGDDNGGGNNPANNNTGGNNGGDATHDGRLINAANEAWLYGSCESATRGFIIESDGGYIKLHLSDNGTWSTGDARTWRTDGNTLIVAKGSNETIYQYEIVSNGTLTLDGTDKYKKCPHH